MKPNQKISHIIEMLEEAKELIAKNNGENINNINKDIALEKIRTAYDRLLKVKTTITETVIESEETAVKTPEVQEPEINTIENTVMDFSNNSEKCIIENESEIEHETIDEPIVVDKKKNIEIQPTLFDKEIIATLTPPDEKTKLLKKEKITETKTHSLENSKTLSDKYREINTKTLSDVITNSNHKKDFPVNKKLQPVKNIKSAISINDRVMFMHDIFDNNSAIYNNTIDEINNMKNLDEAMAYLNKTTNIKKDNEAYDKFLELVSCRFAGNTSIKK
ncbi:MAG: hypothetical protein COX07_06265 [Bacteroidetes bacterium CG23_combo_of_CG06-09_8_20_14_all_32_9]|nr:MAG: hypothetical protein COX07_06265 [Bacteroidetes bacterium CG23_combo_of_CG06-09_8_20_14_all_32_9]